MTARPTLRSTSMLAVAMASLAIGGCATGAPPPVSRAELAQAETFPYFELYWAGPRFRGHPVSAVDVPAPYNPAAGVHVYYGDCAGRGGLLGEGRCQMPLQVSTLLYVPHSNAALGAQRNVLIRDVPAVLYNGGHSIVLYTAHLQIELSSERPADALLATALLRPLNTGGSAAGPLPLPTYCPGLVGPLPAPLAAAMARVRARLPHAACEGSATAAPTR